MLEEFDTFYLKQLEPNKSCLLALRSIILEFDQTISESIKYGMPCFCYNKKPLIYLWKDKKTSEPYLLIVHGNHMDVPMLESGKRTKMKIFRVNPNEDIQIDLIYKILECSILITKRT